MNAVGMKELCQRDEFHLVNSRYHRPSAYKLQSAHSTLSNYELGGGPYELARDVVIVSIKSPDSIPLRIETRVLRRFARAFACSDQLPICSVSRIAAGVTEGKFTCSCILHVCDAQKTLFNSWIA